MSPDDLQLPERGFTKAERAWLEKLIEAIRTVHGISGRNTTIDESDKGQVINADDCAPCP
jgi:hypothetical protein